MLIGQGSNVAFPIQAYGSEGWWVSFVVVGTSYNRFAAFTDDADLADVAYFRLARAEAVALDPQTRILLQVMTR